MSPNELVTLFLGEEIFDLTIKESSLYALRNGRQDPQLSREDIAIFIGILVLTSYLTAVNTRSAAAFHGAAPAGGVPFRHQPAVMFVSRSVILCAVMVGLALLALSFYVRPYLQRHHLVTGQKVNSDLFPYGLIAASAATLISRSVGRGEGWEVRGRVRARKREIFGNVQWNAESKVGRNSERKME
ncbi:hypothetical protein FJT64_006170 [Amphibalanus amphitrite]|uniref:Uncharacterized protein n=1 Tax=Amphibalanus amphitrite TaxID=1232801 RepID=A0A6A4VXP2_AMPAM|nr:hypothetical protein FJT64_006170 [Amphibalanus amphitrite]